MTTSQEITVLVEFTLGDGSRAEDLADRVSDGIAETFAKRPGFVSAELLFSEDDRRMVNVARWQSETAWRAATAAPGSARSSEVSTWLNRRSADDPVARILDEGGAVLESATAYRSARVVPAADPSSPKPVLHHDDPDAERAVLELVDELQAGLDASDGDLYDRSFARDVLWGTPKGQVVDSTDQLTPTHRRLMAQAVAPPSRFELVSWRAPAPGVAVAQIRRRALQPGGFSEVAVYTLVERDGSWWVAAAQNTPVTAE